MRYYSIKISGGASSQNSGNTSGSAGLPVANNGRVAGPVSVAAARAAAFTQQESAPGLRVWDPNTQSNVITVQKGSGNSTGTDFSTPNPPASISPVSGTSVTGAQWTSLVNGVNDPGALDIEFDIVWQQGQDVSAFIKIRGITPQTISQASNFNNCRLQMWGGFSNGLPLANLQVPHQGLILDGTIFPCFGNWIYNELSLDLFVIRGDSSGIGGPTKPKNIVHNMPVGTPLSTAIQNTLQTAFPNSTINVNISDKLKLNYPDWGVYQGLEQFGNYIKTLSHSILGTPPAYKGVSITQNGTNINVTDGTKNTSGAIAIQYTDLIGQPTWIENNTIQVKTCLRGDIPFPNNCLITLPPTLVTQTYSGAVNAMAPDIGGEYSGGTNYLTFQGTWQVTGIRHIGKFRDPSMDSWVTIINAVTNTGGGTAATTAATDAPGGPVNQSGQQTFNPPSGAAPGSSGGIGRA
jgi:hypothetical protein